MNILLLIPLQIFQKMASVEPMLNMVLKQTRRGHIGRSPSNSSTLTSCRKHTMEPPPHVHVADMLKKGQDVESKLSSLTLTKLD